MPAQYKALIVVMLVSAIVLAIGKPLFTRFMAAEDFARRRNFWLALTAASFLAPSFWVYVLIAAPLLLYGARKDPNPVALYLFLLLAVPPLRVQIPTLGIVGQVFPMDHLRLLSLALLLPVAMRLRKTDPVQARFTGVRPASSLATADVLLLSYLGLQFILLLPYESITTTLRRLVLLGIDVGLPYFVVSRACQSREMVTEALAAFVMATLVLAPLAVFEFFRGWMIYAGIQDQWDAGRMFYPLYRGGFMRAITTTGHSINLGYFMAMGFGLWLYLQDRVDSRAWRWLAFVTLLAGLIASLARGPWIGAAIVVIFYLSLGPRAGSRLMQGVVVTAALFALAAVSPLGPQFFEYLPFVGAIDAQTIAMREALAAGSWVLIQQNPFFGSPYFLSYMESFRTGEGIIDLVNTYATISLSFGLVGTALFISIFASLLWKTHRVVRQVVDDADLALMGAAIMACIVGTLAVIATTSFQLALPSMTWALAGLAWAYTHLPIAASAPARYVSAVAPAATQ